ncbi:MAG: phenylpropionate dioxygenase-like ring-hydroxylating dioxygenase large terminal subunit [Saprospiraceae bacterium]|jgi:phenylpropionate dioxygenase-like ring-hydroxylating dioxygenase large terminal subunit
MPVDILDPKLYESVKQPAGKASTLPAWCYTDERYLRAELALFRRSWCSAGRVDRVANVGDYAALNVAGVPIIVTRTEENEINVFSNSCSHRGTQLVEGEGNCKAIRCPFHSWAFDLKGNLLGAPNMQDAPDFDPADFGLTLVRSGERDGFLFVNIEGNAMGLDEWLGDFSDIHTPWNLSDLTTSRYTEFEVDFNWKIFMETFNEYYHLSTVHPSSIDYLYEVPDPADIVMGEYTTQFGAHEGTGGLILDDEDTFRGFPTIASLQGRETAGSRYTWVYPGLTFAASTDSMWMFEVTPLKPNKTLVRMNIAFPNSTLARDDFATHIGQYYERFKVALAEDFIVQEKQQAGYTSPLAKQGRFCERLEPSVANFAHWLVSNI